jgi:hypothetical protein
MYGFIHIYIYKCILCIDVYQLIDVNLKGTFREGLLALCSQLAKDVSGIYLLIAGEGAPHITVQRRRSKEEKAPSLTSLKQLRLASLKLRFLWSLCFFVSLFFL